MITVYFNLDAELATDSKEEAERVASCILFSETKALETELSFNQVFESFKFLMKHSEYNDLPPFDDREKYPLLASLYSVHTLLTLEKEYVTEELKDLQRMEQELRYAGVYVESIKKAEIRLNRINLRLVEATRLETR